MPVPEVSGHASGMIDELTPQAVLALVLEQRRHHLPVPVEDARARRVICRQRSEQLCRPRRHPAVAAAPVERRIGRVEEQAVRLLQPVEIGHHRLRRAIDVPRSPVARYACTWTAVIMYMSSIQYRASVVMPSGVVVSHCVSAKLLPRSRNRRSRVCMKISSGTLPNTRKSTWAFGRDVLRALRREQRIELPHEPRLEVGVARERCHRQRAVPRADLRVDDEAGRALERPGDEVLGDALADVLRRRTRRPVGEVTVPPAGVDAPAPPPSGSTPVESPSGRASSS